MHWLDAGWPWKMQTHLNAHRVPEAASDEREQRGHFS
jgi:hypothetical protein